MNVHENARPTPRGREISISRLQRGEHRLGVGTAMGVSAGTVYKWRRRASAMPVGRGGFRPWRLWPRFMTGAPAGGGPDDPDRA